MLANCWEVKKCGREAGGVNVKGLGICPAYPDHGHSCWVVAGTYCKGEVQGTFAQKQGFCNLCDVYKLYSTSFGTSKKELMEQHPEEYQFCLSYFSRL